MFVYLLSCGPLAAGTPAPGGAPAAQHENLLDKIAEGGWVMIPIALRSVLTVYLIADGIARTSARRVAPPAQVKAVQDLFRQGDYVGAYQYCKANPSPLTNVLRNSLFRKMPYDLLAGVHIGDEELLCGTSELGRRRTRGPRHGRHARIRVIPGNPTNITSLWLEEAEEAKANRSFRWHRWWTCC